MTNNSKQQLPGNSLVAQIASSSNKQPGGQDPTAPDYRSISKQEPVDPDTARKTIEGRPLPTNVYVPKAAGTVLSIAAGNASNTAQGPASIVEQARSLKNDVDLIHQFVTENIEFLGTYGLQKSGIGALSDGFGNSFDQADLMVQLLRQAGYSANYLFGELEMDATQLANWLGTDSANIFSSSNLLANGGIPNTVIFGTPDKVRFSHVWVKWLDPSNSTWYVFDPAMKSYTTTTGINMATALGYNATTFMNNARSGSTVTSDYVQNLSRTNVRNDLNTLSANLVSWIKTNNHGAGIDDILGGRKINAITTGQRITSLPYQRPAATPTEWTAVPNSYKALIHLVYDSPNIDVTFYSADLQGKRLTLSFNAGHQAELRLDGSLIATSSAQGVGTWNSILLDVQHPYAGSWANSWVWERVWADKFYTIANSWGNSGYGTVNTHLKNVRLATVSGVSDDSEASWGEVQTAMAQNMAFANSRATDIVNKLSQCYTVSHHACGLIGWFDTMFVDMGAVTGSSSALDNNYDRVVWNDTAIAMFGVSTEASTIEAMSGVPGVSTTPLIDSAVAAGQRIYDGKTANWLSTVKPGLSNYPPADLTGIESNYINNGYRVGLPANGALVLGSWNGYGYWAIPPQGSFGIIAGGLKGGSGAEARTKKKVKEKVELIPLVPSFDNTPTNKPPLKGHVSNDPPQQHQGPANQDPNRTPPQTPNVGDPLLISSGEHYQTATDITVGSSAFPYRLDFTRSYAVSRRSTDGPLGLGWTHNWLVNAVRFTDFDMALGKASAISCAPALAALFVAADLQSDLVKPFDKYVTTSLLMQWLNEKIVDNVVSVTRAGSSSVFVSLPDGSFVPPVNEPGSALIKNVDGTYTYKTSAQVAYNFNALNRLATIVYPGGITVTVSYTTDQVSSVTNGLGRTLTLAYTGTRLSSVSDGNGRSVSYVVDANKNLVQYTNANAKSTVYGYDLPGRLTQVFLPANPLTAVVTTVYDSLDRVKQQINGLNQTWNYYIAGSRSEEVDPLGNKVVYFFNRVGYTTKIVNSLNQVRTLQYDGALRQIKATFPEGNSLEWTYNNKNFITAKTTKPKTGSPLANLVESFTYNATWNKVATMSDALSRVTTFTYDPANGNLLTIQRPVVGGFTPTVTLTWNARGQVLTQTDETGIVTKYVYDAVTEKLTSVVSDFGVGRLNLTTNLGYNAWGDILSIQDPRGNTTNRVFDVLRRLTQITAPAPLSYITNIVYTDNSEVSSIQRQTGDVLNPWQTTSFTYSITSKLKTVTDPSSHVTVYDYDGVDRPWKTTDAENRVTENGYDALSRLSTVKDSSLTIAETRTFSANGLISSIKDARNNTTGFTYDGHDRSDRTNYPDSTFEQATTYDLVGNVLTSRTRSGNTITMTYDALNRLSTRTPQGRPTETFTYDLAGRLLTASKPVVASDPSSGTFSITYDTAGRQSREQYPDGKQFNYQMDANGNTTRITWPDNWFVDRVFDPLNRLTDIKLNGALTSAIQFQFDPLSRRKKTIYENGCVADFGFELDNDPNSIVQTFVGSSVTFTHTFNNVGEMLSQQVSDSLFMWHPATAGTSNYGIADSVNKYPTVAGVAQTYNGNACLTGDGTWTFTYSTDNQMLTAVKTGTSLAFKYDPFGRQVEKSVGATKTRFYYSGLQRLGDYSSAGALQTRYVYGLALDEVMLQVTSAGVKSYFHHNHQGSVIAKTNASGSVLNRYAYSPFGESAALTGTTHGFNGQRVDSESGLYFYKTRYFSPKTGRFLEPDKVGYLGGFNLYAYVNNSPLNFIDPLGFAPANNGGEPVGGGGSDPLEQADYLAGKLIELTRIVEGDEFTDYLVKEHSHQENIRIAAEKAIAARLGGAALQALYRKGYLNNLIGQIGIVKHIEKFGESVGKTKFGDRVYDHARPGAGGDVVSEIKTGIANATGNVLKEANRDVQNALGGMKIEWHFYKSPISGQGGPSLDLAAILLSARDSAGNALIKIIIHD